MFISIISSGTKKTYISLDIDYHNFTVKNNKITESVLGTQTIVLQN